MTSFDLVEALQADTSWHNLPHKVWKFYPNRIEILVLNALISSPKIKVGWFELTNQIEHV